MSDTPAWRFISTLLATFSAAWRRRRTDARSQQLGTYICSSIKPPVVEGGRGFALFYRSRFVWNIAQGAFFVALAYWTIKNYVVVIKSL